MKRERFAWQLPPEIESRLGESSYGRQRAIFEAGHLLLILHRPPGRDDVGRRSAVFLRKPDGALLCNGEPDGDAKLTGLLDAYRQQYQEHDTAYDKAGDAEDLFQVLETLAPLNRASTNLHNALQSAREHADAPLLIAMRDEAYELSRNFELLTADAKLALDYRIARAAEAHAAKAHETTVAQHKLNILAALTFPLMALATLFGMNLASGLENGRPYLFWLVFAAGLVVGLLLKSWVTHAAPTSTPTSARQRPDRYARGVPPIKPREKQ